MHEPLVVPQAEEAVRHFNWHKRSLVANGAAFFFFALTLALAMGGAGLGVLGGFIPFLIFYIFYLIECCCSSSLSFLSNQQHVERAQSAVEAMQSQPPIVSMFVQCYHYETRTRTVSVRNSDGSTSLRTETYTERVVTYSETVYMPYGSWMDVTGAVSGLANYPLSKLHFDVAWEAADDETAAAQKAIGQELRERCRHFDVHMDYGEGATINEFQPHILALVGADAMPALLSVRWYWIFSLLLLSWPYRIWFERLSISKDITFRKVISLQPHLPNRPMHRIIEDVRAGRIAPFSPVPVPPPPCPPPEIIGSGAMHAGAAAVVLVGPPPAGGQFA
jgi:hypothetical protein